MSDGPVVRPGRSQDLDRIAVIQDSSPDAAHWNVRDYLDHDFRVIERDGLVAGFAVVRNVCPGESELLSIAIDPEMRRCGLGRALLDDIAARHPGDLYLEVRASNATAQTFYKSFGFQEVGFRAGYYRDPPEGAVVMKYRSC